MVHGEVDRIQRELARLPEMREVTVQYANSSGFRHGVRVLFTGRAGSDLPALTDAALKAVWTSRVTPLETLIVWGKAEGSETVTKTELDVSDTETMGRLTEQFGPRPAN